MKRRTWIIIGVVAAVALAAIWFVRREGQDPASRYRTQEVALGELTEAVTANGTINPVRVINVGTQVSGTLAKLNVDYNDRVAAGQVLAEIDPRVYAARLQQSEAQLANLRANLALAQANAARAEQLYKQQFISRQDYDTARASVATNRAQTQAAEAQIAQDRANLGFTVIRSPVSGVVISRQVDIGQTVAASFQTPTLFTIARDLTQMQIEAQVAEADVSRVRVGQPVEFTVDAYGARRFKGAVKQIRLNPTTQQNVVTYTVVVAVPNPDGALLPGMTANATFLVRRYERALLVPNGALSWKPADWTPDKARDLASRDPLGKDPAAVTLFRLGADGPEPVRVRTGAADVDRTIVTAGALKAGDRVIIGLASDKPAS